jgi:DNA methylase
VRPSLARTEAGESADLSWVARKNRMQRRGPHDTEANPRMTDPNLVELYRHPIPSTRVGPIYNAFSYPTKIDPEAIGLFVATHTEPGGVVLDVFGGSGTTAVACRLCERPTQRMRDLAAATGVNPTWGPRRAIVYELSPVGSLLGRVLANPPDPVEFADAAQALVATAAESLAKLYVARSPVGEPGQIRYVIWSEVLRTPCCREVLTLWDAAVRRKPLELAGSFSCPRCASRVTVKTCDRVLTTKWDSLTGTEVTQRERRPAFVYGMSRGRTWSRPVTEDDVALLKEIDDLPVAAGIPVQEIKWGDLYRSGYHAGITHLHHLYTPRNLRALATLWSGAERYEGRLGDALRLLILSYNASHSTLLTRVVVKKGQKDFVVTGAQSGVLYVSGLPVEKNVLDGVRRKVKTFGEAFTFTYGLTGRVDVINSSSTRLDLPDDCVDYLFTDPPFGDFIPYAEVNQVNEAWMDHLTDQTEEAIISPAQGKGVDEYRDLITRVFVEAARVLKPTAAATLVFHASKPVVWEALGTALRDAGLVVERTSVLDKVQVSFKQVVHDGTRGDAVFLLRFATGHATVQSEPDRTLASILDQLELSAAADPDEVAPRRMYSRYVARCIEAGVLVALSASDFYAHLEVRRGATVQSRP